MKTYFSVIILTFNRKEKLKKLLISLRNQTYKDFEVIIVDNHSTDGTKEIVKKFYPEVKYIYMSRNIGIRGYNIGVKFSSSEYLIFIDGDVVLEKNFIEKINEKTKIFSSNTVIVGKLLNYFSGKIAWDNTFHLKEGNEKDGFLTTCFNGSFFCISKSLWEKAGGTWEFDTPYLWERDFSIRVLKKGGIIRYFPSIIGYHNTEETNKEEIQEKRKLIWYYTILISLKYFYLPKALEQILREGIYSILDCVFFRDASKIKNWIKLLKEAIFILIKKRKPIRKDIKCLLKLEKKMTNTF